MGLNGIFNSAINNWVAPVFFVALAIAAVVLMYKKEIRGLIMLALIAAIAALFIFAGPALFGANGIFTGIGKDAANQINTILLFMR